MYAVLLPIIHTITVIPSLPLTLSAYFIFSFALSPRIFVVVQLMTWFQSKVLIMSFFQLKNSCLPNDLQLTFPWALILQGWWEAFQFAFSCQVFSAIKIWMRLRSIFFTASFVGGSWHSALKCPSDWYKVSFTIIRTESVSSTAHFFNWSIPPAIPGEVTGSRELVLSQETCFTQQHALCLWLVSLSTTAQTFGWPSQPAAQAWSLSFHKSEALAKLDRLQSAVKVLWKKSSPSLKPSSLSDFVVQSQSSTKWLWYDLQSMFSWVSSTLNLSCNLFLLFTRLPSFNHPVYW